MLRRMLVLYASLLLVVLTALEVPLAIAFAGRQTQNLFIDQLNDTARFASLAEPALRSGETVTLRAELSRYDALYGIAAAVVDRNGEVVLSSRAGADIGRRAGRRLRDALSGERSDVDEVVWPWRKGPLIVAEPVGLGGRVVAAVVTIAPTTQVRARTVRRWSELAAAGLGALLVFGLAAVPLTRWFLRPIRELDVATGELSAGQWQARVPVTTGPAELRRLGEHFNEMVAALGRVLEQQRSFVSYAGHQMRNPLAALRLRVENLAPHVPPGGEDDLALAVDEVTRLSRILDGILALARAEGGNYPIRVVDCGRVAREQVDARRRVSPGARIRYRGAAHAAAYAVQGGVGQIVEALIDNAVKFAGPGATVTVTVSRPRALPDAPDAPVVGIDVVDDGPGMPEADLANATQRFWRGAGQQNVDGTGLGLSIVSVLAEASGGRVVLMPARPRGLHVQVVLPAATGTGPPPGPLIPRPWSPGSSGSPRDAAAADRSTPPTSGPGTGPRGGPPPARPGG
ncbi:HAMP domain-containing protein [Actinomadura sp. LD22]|uniref:histidine kinase n=1 Tax=Actinomadura physcomitrii TaxID=2650748 RepID=A0A6I4MGB5_9ACTN|nr:HAMP domain-containing protein [Actinomadura physcomitrii]